MKQSMDQREEQWAPSPGGINTARDRERVSNHITWTIRKQRKMKSSPI